jgi:hypothetical protein
MVHPPNSTVLYATKDAVALDWIQGGACSACLTAALPGNRQLIPKTATPSHNTNHQRFLLLVGPFVVNAGATSHVHILLRGPAPPQSLMSTRTNVVRTALSVRQNNPFTNKVITVQYRCHSHDSWQQIEYHNLFAFKVS